MKRIRRGYKALAGVAVAAVAAFAIIAFFPVASAEPAEDGIEITSSEAVVFDTDYAGLIEKARVVTFFGLRGDGSVDVRKDKALEDSGKWQGVRGFTVPVVEGDELVWKGLKVDGNANYLSSTMLGEEAVSEVRMKIPLSIKYIYEWNGEIISDPNEVTGQDGHFKLTLKMKNTSGEKTLLEYTDPQTGETRSEEVETYLPLVILPYDWYFDNAVFFNLKADPTGIVVPLPEHFQVGWSIPLFPPASEDEHTIWVEADVKDFSLPPLVLSANFVFPQTNQRDTLPEFIFGLETLYDGVKQLHAGLSQGVAGLGSAETENTLLYGTNAVLDGLKQMAAGLPEAAAAIKKDMIPGVEQAVAGIGSPGTPNTLRFAIDQSSLGLMQMVAGLGGPDVANSAIWAMNAMAAGLNEMAAGIGESDQPDTLLYGLNETKKGLGLIKAGIGSTSTPDTLLYGMDAIGGGLLRMKAGLGSATTRDTLLYAVAQIQGGLEMLKEGIGSPTTPDTLLYAVDQVQAGLNEMLAGVNEMFAGIRSGDPANPGMLEGMQEIRGGLASIWENTSETSQLRQALGLIRILAPWTGPLVDQLENGIIFSADPDNPSIHYGCQLMMEGMDQLIAGVGSPGAEGTLLWGLDQIRKGIDDPDPNALDLMYALGAMEVGLRDAIAGIGSAGTPDTMLFGLDQMAKGLGEMLAGIGSSGVPDTLLYGVMKVEEGLREMAAGIGEAGASNTLLYAMDAMSDGLRKMKEGIGSANTKDSLIYAVKEVTAGLEQMKMGIGAEGAPDTLLYAMSQVQHGLVQMQQGLSSGDLKHPGLKEGLILVSSGLNQAVAGLGSTSTPDTLLYGADQVNSGVEQVKEGLVQATEQGTALMIEGLAENLSMLYLTEAQLEAIKKRGEEFDHIIGRTQGATNSLAFIYQTPPTYNYAKGSKSSWLVAGILSVAIIVSLLLFSLLLRRKPVVG